MATESVAQDQLRAFVERIADKYVGKKGGRPKAGKAETPDPDMPKSGKDSTLPLVGTAIPFPPPKPAPFEALTMKQALFVQEYLVDFNGTSAAIRAGHPAKAAAQVAYENLRKPHIRAAIEAAKRDQLERVGANADTVLKILLADVHADIADLFDEHENLRPVKDWPPAFRRGLVAGFEVEELYAGAGADRVKVGVFKKFKLADRTPLKKLLGDHVMIQAFKEKRELGIPEGSPLDVLARELKGTALRPRDIEVTARDITPPQAQPAVLRPREA